jgi:EAL domain-containing protein (putative c-di-GMP-specific phosphodiesterase class I)
MVKIAGAFIENLPRSRDDQAFVKALTELARNFDIEIVAEWVQDEETVAMLAGFGVHMMQGMHSGMAGPEWSLTREPAPIRKAG